MGVLATRETGTKWHTAGKLDYLKIICVAAIIGACTITFVWPIDTDDSAVWNRKPFGQTDTKKSLATLALDKVRHEASSIFGTDSSTPDPSHTDATTAQSTSQQSSLSTWMSSIPDETKLVHINIPGAHDAATWNYTLETQQSLKRVTDLVNVTLHPPEWRQCQTQSILKMLNAGVRALDMRYAQDVTREKLVFWHGAALLSQSATVEDVLFGFYNWLDKHPSETVFVSFQYEENTYASNSNTLEPQTQLYNALTSPAAKKYILQQRHTLGTLGAARGKMILLRRFDLNLLPPSCQETIPGIHFSPGKWVDNSAKISIIYNDHPEDGEDGVAYIEDYYQPKTAPSSTLQENQEIKFDAIQSHLKFASSDEHPNALFWGFASGKNIGFDQPLTPWRMSQGDAENTGVNLRVMEILKHMRGKRVGIVMFDFIDEPEELVSLVLNMKEP